MGRECFKSLLAQNQKLGIFKSKCIIAGKRKCYIQYLANLNESEYGATEIKFPAFSN